MSERLLAWYAVAAASPSALWWLYINVRGSQDYFSGGSVNGPIFWLGAGLFLAQCLTLYLLASLPKKARFRRFLSWLIVLGFYGFTGVMVGFAYFLHRVLHPREWRTSDIFVVAGLGLETVVSLLAIAGLVLVVLERRSEHRALRNQAGPLAY